MKILITVLLSILIFLSVSCKESGSESMTEGKSSSENSVDVESDSTTLQYKLDQRKINWEKTAPEEKKKIYAEGLDAVRNSGILEKAKNNGDQAPDFTLMNAVGDLVNLKQTLEKGPVVLTWYRGGWCPYCNLTLHRLQAELPKFKAEGATLLTLSPELPDKSLSTKEKHQLEFEVLSDVGNKVAKDYGIVFKLTPEVADSYQNAFDLHGYNGDESNELPLAATYVIDTDGKIKYTFLDADYRKRAEPAEILEALRALKP